MYLFLQICPSANKQKGKEQRAIMKKNDKYENVSLDEDDIPLVEIELDEESEDGGGGKTGAKIVLTVMIILALLAAGFFAFRFIQGRNTAVVLPKPSEVKQDSSVTVTDTQSTGEDTGTVAETNEGSVSTPAPTPTPVPTPTPKPTPPPTPTPPPIPEEYVIPGVDAGDLSAVRTYIQTQLDAIAADLYCPNIDEITANEDCTVFTAICNSLNESEREREAASDLFKFGKMYAAYAGTAVDEIRIDYKNRVGDLLWTRSSKDS